MTTCSVSPDAFGAFRSSRFTASKLCVPDSRKLSLYALPAAAWMAVRPTSATTHASTTNLRWVKHTLASLLTVDSLQLVGGQGQNEDAYCL